MTSRARERWLCLTLTLLAGVAACGGPQKLGGAGTKCFRDDDCQAGLICVAPTEGDIHRVCSNDPTPIISMVEMPEPVASGGTGGTAGSAGATTAGTQGEGGSGGKPATYGGTDSGGTASAGKATGGTDSGGTDTGGTGGTDTGGTDTGGTDTGGTDTAGGAPP